MFQSLASNSEKTDSQLENFVDCDCWSCVGLFDNVRDRDFF